MTQIADYTSIKIDCNKGTDASPSWSNSSTESIGFGGSAGADELRFTDTANNVTGTASASWPYTTRPASGVAPVRYAYLYHTDGAGVLAATYNGDKTNSLVFRLNHDNTGTYASAPRWSAFATSALPSPSPGTQTMSATDGSNIINGANPDTGTSPITSYLKGNGYGSGMTAAGVQETPAAGAAGTTLAATTGDASGTHAPSAGAYLATWCSLQGWTSYITLPAIPKATTAFYYYFSLALFMGVSMLPGVFSFSPIVLDYTYA